MKTQHHPWADFLRNLRVWDGATESPVLEVELEDRLRATVLVDDMSGLLRVPIQPRCIAGAAVAGVLGEHSGLVYQAPERGAWCNWLGTSNTAFRLWVTGAIPTGTLAPPANKLDLEPRAPYVGTLLFGTIPTANLPEMASSAYISSIGYLIPRFWVPPGRVVLYVSNGTNVLVNLQISLAEVPISAP